MANETKQIKMVLHANRIDLGPIENYIIRLLDSA